MSEIEIRYQPARRYVPGEKDPEFRWKVKTETVPGVRQGSIIIDNFDYEITRPNGGVPLSMVLDFLEARNVDLSTVRLGGLYGEPTELIWEEPDE